MDKVKVGCPDTIYGFHSPTDGQGRCGWCGQKVDPALSRPKGRYVKPHLETAYEYFYDPDFGTDTRDSY